MKKYLSYMLSGILVLTIIFTTNIPVFAHSADNILQNVESQISDDLVTEGINASVHTMTATDTSSFLYYLKSKSEVADLKHKLKSDDYILDSERVAAFEILDNDSYDAVIFAYEVYVNSSNDTVMVTYIYDETTDILALSYAQEITSDSKVSDYHVCRHASLTDQPVAHSVVMARKSDPVSFLCGLSSTVACGAFSAMLFAFVPASIAVGLSCSAAFAWVCSHA